MNSIGKWYLNFSYKLSGTDGMDDYDRDNDIKIPLKAKSLNKAIAEGTKIFNEMTVKRLGEIINDNDINWWENIKIYNPFSSFNTEISEGENILRSLL